MYDILTDEYNKGKTHDEMHEHGYTTTLNSHKPSQLQPSGRSKCTKPTPIAPQNIPNIRHFTLILIRTRNLDAQ